MNTSTGTITLANNGFTNNEAVTYRGPTAAHFLGTQVNTSNGNIVIGPSQTGDAFQTNDRVTYTVSAASPGAATTALGGLSVGGTYYVYRVDANTIRLSTTQITTDAQGNPVGTWVTITTSSGANLTQHNFTRVGQSALGGLVDGQTYYVKVIDANNFQLAATPGGATIAISTSGVSGAQFIGVEGIDLTGTGVTGQHWFALPLSGSLTGTQRLIGAGGVTATPNEFGITGVSTATSIGPSVALGISAGRCHRGDQLQLQRQCDRRSQRPTLQWQRFHRLLDRLRQRRRQVRRVQCRLAG